MAPRKHAIMHPNRAGIGPMLTASAYAGPVPVRHGAFIGHHHDNASGVLSRQRACLRCRWLSVGYENC